MIGMVEMKTMKNGKYVTFRFNTNGSDSSHNPLVCGFTINTNNLSGTAKEKLLTLFETAFITQDLNINIFDEYIEFSSENLTKDIIVTALVNIDNLIRLEKVDHDSYSNYKRNHVYISINDSTDIAIIASMLV